MLAPNTIIASSKVKRFKLEL